MAPPNSQEAGPAPSAPVLGGERRARASAASMGQARDPDVPLCTAPAGFLGPPHLWSLAAAPGLPTYCSRTSTRHTQHMPALRGRDALFWNETGTSPAPTWSELQYPEGLSGGTREAMGAPGEYSTPQTLQLLLRSPPEEGPGPTVRPRRTLASAAIPSLQGSFSSDRLLLSHPQSPRTQQLPQSILGE